MFSIQEYVENAMIDMEARFEMQGGREISLSMLWMVD